MITKIDVVITVQESFNNIWRISSRYAVMIMGIKHIHLSNKPSTTDIVHVYDAQFFLIISFKLSYKII